MYLSEKVKKLAEKLFTKQELLFEKTTTKKVIDLIKKENNIVVYSKVTENYYGEFLFPEIFDEISGLHIQFYGLGFDHFRDNYFNHFVIHNIYITTMDEILKLVDYSNDYNKIEVINQIKERAKEIEKMSKNHIQSENGIIFSELADIGDTDGAIALMEDMKLF